MKKLSIILNVVLLVAVGWLFVKVYGNQPGNNTGAQLNSKGMPSRAIVFINSDSLLDEYSFFNQLKDELESKQDSVDKVLRSMADVLDREVGNYQEKGAGMTMEQRAKEEERLMKKQQYLIDTKERLLDDLQQRESQMNDSIHENLNRFLKEYNKDKNYYFILGYQRGSGILFANDSLDITREVLDGLNK